METVHYCKEQERISKENFRKAPLWQKGYVYFFVWGLVGIPALLVLLLIIYLIITIPLQLLGWLK